MDEYDRIMKRIGEFVVCFQWLEHRFREMGWLILDPGRTGWPPQSLRKESNHDLLIRVGSLFSSLMDQLSIDDATVRKDEFANLISQSHALRRYRNSLLHSAYIELKAGSEIVGLMRSNPKLKRDAESGEDTFDQEMLSEDSIVKKLKELAEITVALNRHYMQLIHWAPFEAGRASQT